LTRFPEVLAGSEELKQMVWVSGAGLLIYTLGVLAWAIWVCWNAPVLAHSASFRMKYYFLIDGYRPDRWWWGTLVLIKGLLLNLTLAVFDSPKTQNVFCSVIFMVSLAMLFLANPWPKLVQNIIDTMGHLACAMLLATTSFYIRVDDGSSEERDIASISMIAPLVVAVMCMALPLWQFGIRKSRAINTYRYGQKMRDLMLLIVRRNNNEMNSFLHSLDDSELQTINNAQDIFYSKMFFLHPSRSILRDRLITEVDEYRVATDLVMALELEQSIVTERRDDCKSLRERAEMQWFFECLSEEWQKKNKSSRPLTINRIWDVLDADGSGDLTRDEFVDVVATFCPLIHADEAEEIFDMMDLDASGEISKEEFDIIMKGMTFRGQELDLNTLSGKLLRAGASKKDLALQRNAVARLAMVLEGKRNMAGFGNSEFKRRARARTARLVTQRVREILDGRKATMANGKPKDKNSSVGVLPAPKQPPERQPPILVSEEEV